MAFHTPHGSARFRLPWSWSSFDYRDAVPGALRADRRPLRDRQGRAPRARRTVVTDRGDADRAGHRRRARLAARARPAHVQPPEAPLSRGLEVHPHGALDRPRRVDRPLPRPLRLRLERARRTASSGSASAPTSRATTSRTPTQDIAARLDRDAVRYQGNWFPHRLRPATEDGVFFAGDSAGHCLPLSGEGIRPAFYFGIAAAREIRAGAGGRAVGAGRAQPLSPRSAARHAPAFTARARAPARDSPAAAEAAHAAAEAHGPRASLPTGVRLVPHGRRPKVRKRLTDRESGRSDPGAVSTLVFHTRPGFDALTGLPDRAAFIAGLRSPWTPGEGVAVLFLDLDDFKVVNDGFGHEAGDRLLIQVAQRLRGAVHDGDLVARIGGDEFTVLCAGADVTGATITAGRIRGALSAPFDIGGQRRHASTSSSACARRSKTRWHPTRVLAPWAITRSQTSPQGEAWPSISSRRSTSPRAASSAPRRSCAGARRRPSSSSRSPRGSASDWNRRPLVGRSAPRGRRSPWAESSA